MTPGDVLCSTAGRLPFRAILHAVGQKWEGDGQSAITALKKTVYNALQVTARKRFEIIAFPAIGTGAYKVPADQSTAAIVETIKQFWQDYPLSGVREVYLCDRGEHGIRTTQAFVKAIQGHFADDDKLCANPPVLLSTQNDSKTPKSNMGIFMLP